MAAADSPRVTLAKIAEIAGVSTSTISKVFNGRSDVSQQTRERVEALLTQHGYLRRGSGRTRSGLIELVFHQFESAWSMEIIRGVEDVASEHGLSVVLTQSGTRHEPGPEWVEGVIQRRPEAVLLVFSGIPDSARQALRTRDIPFAIIDPAGDPAPDVPSVGSANWAGGLMATRHLIELGHTKIAAITGPEDMLCSHARLDGFRSAMSGAGIEINPDWVRFGNFYTSGGEQHARDLLAQVDRPTAIFAGSDLQALGVLEACRALHLRVPDDLSLVGYDDIPMAQWVSPRLTTVRQPLREMGAEATRMVLRLRQDSGGPTPRMDLATNLVVRDSTARPN